MEELDLSYEMSVFNKNYINYFTYNQEDKACNLESNIYVIDCNGDIYPCVFLPIKIGNIRGDDLSDLWRNSMLLKRLRNRDSFQGCGTCEHKHICGGCRARAYGYFGDVQGPDPGCVVNLKYWEQLRKKAEDKNETSTN